MRVCLYKKVLLFLGKGLLVGFSLGVFDAYGQVIYVSPQGKDSWPGTEKKPVGSVEKAQELAREYGPDVNVEVIFDDGIYYLPKTVCFSSADSKLYPATVTYRAKNRGQAVISGGQRLDLKWKKGEKGVWVAQVPEPLVIDQLYINGKRQRMARFPNAEPGENKNVFDTWVLSHSTAYDAGMDPLTPDRISGWENPEGGIVHAMHSALWGDMHWVITGKAGKDSLRMEGGWQNNRPSAMHPVYRMVENVKEELDVPGEWYYDREKGVLSYMPEAGTDMKRAVVEIVRLKHLIEFNGCKEQPVSGVNLEGFVFRHASRTFMENKEPLLRSDWTVYRGGAVVYNGATDCQLLDCEFDQVGGNSVFVNNYNRRIEIKGCYIHHSGANGIAFVGDPKMVRSPLFRYGRQHYEGMDTVPGPKGDNYPLDCKVEDCLITLTGRDEKQTAPVQISMSQRITVRYCSIYDVPRAGINISEGTFGGHLIEYCDIFNTVLETGDHGSFNSWGRDRYWTPDVPTFSRLVTKNPDMTYWDMVEPNTIRHNRWRCDHGWDIDLDDGSSHYRIYNNVLLNGGLKMREGYDRIVKNNVIVNNGLHPHVWPRENGDVFKYNIVFTSYQPAVMQSDLRVDEKWGKELDYNFFASGRKEMERFFINGADWHSQCGDPQFVDAENGDYRVSDCSRARMVGFQNFDMDEFGVRSAHLKKIAKTPLIPRLNLSLEDKKQEDVTETWMGCQIKEAKGSDLSAFGVGFDKEGIAFERVDEGSLAAKIGIKSGDLLQKINDVRITSFSALRAYLKNNKQKEQVLSVIRAQEEITIRTTKEGMM